MVIKTVSTTPTIGETYNDNNGNNNYKSVSNCDNATINESSTTSWTSTTITNNSILCDTTAVITNKSGVATTKSTTPPPTLSSGSKPNGPKQVVQQQIRNGWFRWLFGGCSRIRKGPATKKYSNKNVGGNTTETMTMKNPASASFLRLARERRFDDIVTVLAQSSPTFISTWLQVQQVSRSSICECLHALCLYRPTPSAVRAVQVAIQSAYTYIPNPSTGTIDTTTTTPTNGCLFSNGMVVNAALVTDAHGRTPLHIAVACGCSFAVVDLLLHDDYEAAYMMDHTNRYPLHWACTCSYLMSNAKSYSSREREIDDVVKIINRLMEIYAVAVLSKDDMGCTPLDIAKSVVNADPRIVRALQFVKNILPVKKRIKSHPDEATVITGGGMTKYPMREAICIYHNDSDDNDNDRHYHHHNFMDDVSSIGSRGVSKARPRRARRTRSESPKRSSGRIRELVDI